MKIEYVNSEKMQEVSINIKNLVTEYNDIINALFDRINNMNKETKEWIGNQADVYVNQVMNEKQDYINFGNKINEFADAIARNASETVNISSENNRTEGSVIW